MSQTQPLSQIAVACIDGMPEGWTITRRNDGAVVVRIPSIKTPHPTRPEIMVGPDYSEVRVDSDKDRDARLKGQTVWYDSVLLASEKAAKNSKSSDKSESK